MLSYDHAGDGEPLLLLHGFPCTRELWRPLVQRMQGFRCIAPDLLGYGSSPSADECGMAAQIAPLLELLDRLELSSVNLVAHDVGTAAAQLFTLAHPHRVRRLALLDGVYETEWAMAPIESIRAWDEKKAARLQPVLARKLRNIRPMLDAYAGEDGGRRLIRAARCLDPQETSGATARLRESGIPVRVIWASHDDYLPLETVGRPLARDLGVEPVVLEGGHFLPVDNPDGAARAIRDFLGEPVLETGPHGD
jgi:pimeloyl-ACP methyl ester carboxylesterase